MIKPFGKLRWFWATTYKANYISSASYDTYHVREREQMTTVIGGSSVYWLHLVFLVEYVLLLGILEIIMNVYWLQIVFIVY